MPLLLVITCPDGGRGGEGLGVTSEWSPLGNFIEGQAHPVIETDIFSDVFCKIFVHSIYVFFQFFFSLSFKWPYSPKNDVKKIFFILPKRL